MKKIAVLTSGGDAPGMNACIRAVVLTCERLGLEAYGYLHGYNGLLQQQYKKLEAQGMHNLIQRGGTILHSARCLEFKTPEAAVVAANNLNELNIDALIVIGGDGSFRGANHLSQHWQGKVIGLPGTIDNDIFGTDATIGYYTAIETAVSSIDKVRDTADAFERIFLIEVMGRHAGFIALNAALASASDHVIIPELFESRDKALAAMLEELQYRRENHGSISYIIVIAENVWPGGLSDLVSELEQRTGSEVRPVILGHVQRGGSPVPQDRILASKLGSYAVQALLDGQSGVMIAERNGEPVAVPLAQTWAQQKPIEPFCVEAMSQLVNATTD